MSTTVTSVSRDTQVVVIGAGFAGLHAARVLTSAGCRVTIIDRHPYTTFQPLLYQVANGGLNPGDVTYALRTFTASRGRHCRFRRAKVTGIDTVNRRVIVDSGDPIGYDYVVLAMGVGANFYGIPGAAEHSQTIYTRAQAIETRDRIFGGVEALTVNPDRTLRVVVVGGGPTGVEMAGALAEMQQIGLPRAFPEVRPTRVKVSIVEATDNLLGPFAPKLRDYTRKELEKRGVDVCTGQAIKQVTDDKLLLADGSEIPHDMVIWAAGVGAHATVADWGLPQGRGGRVVLEDDLRVKGSDRIFGAGDATLIESNPLPQLAQPAIQMGKHAAHQLLATAEGRPTQAFTYFDKGTMATIGHNSAIVQLPNGLKLTGFIAWAGWVVLHLAFLLGGRNRIQAMINLGTRWLMYSRNAGAIVGDLRMPEEHQELPRHDA